jgi:hypothetical protein
MQQIYQVTIRGKVLESRDLRKLLSRAVFEKKMMDRRFRLNFPNSAVRIAEPARA